MDACKIASTDIYGIERHNLKPTLHVYNYIL